MADNETPRKPLYTRRNPPSRPPPGIQKALNNFGVPDLRKFLDKKHQEQGNSQGEKKLDPKNIPPPDPSYNYLRDPSRDKLKPLPPKTGDNRKPQERQFINRDRLKHNQTENPQPFKNREQENNKNRAPQKYGSTPPQITHPTKKESTQKREFSRFTNNSSKNEDGGTLGGSTPSQSTHPTKKESTQKREFSRFTNNSSKNEDGGTLGGTQFSRGGRGSSFRGRTPRTGRGGRPIHDSGNQQEQIQNPVNIKVQLSTETGHRSCILDKHTKIAEIKQVPYQPPTQRSLRGTFRGARSNFRSRARGGGSFQRRGGHSNRNSNPDKETIGTKEESENETPQEKIANLQNDAVKAQLLKPETDTNKEIDPAAEHIEPHFEQYEEDYQQNGNKNYEGEFVTDEGTIGTKEESENEAPQEKIVNLQNDAVKAQLLKPETDTNKEIDPAAEHIEPHFEQYEEDYQQNGNKNYEGEFVTDEGTIGTKEESENEAPQEKIVNLQNEAVKAQLKPEPDTNKEIDPAAEHIEPHFEQYEEDYQQNCNKNYEGEFVTDEGTIGTKEESENEPPQEKIVNLQNDAVKAQLKPEPDTNKEIDPAAEHIEPHFEQYEEDYQPDGNKNYEGVFVTDEETVGTKEESENGAPQEKIVNLQNNAVKAQLKPQTDTNEEIYPAAEHIEPHFEQYEDYQQDGKEHYEGEFVTDEETIGTKEESENGAPQEKIVNLQNDAVKAQLKPETDTNEEIDHAAEHIEPHFDQYKDDQQDGKGNYQGKFVTDEETIGTKNVESENVASYQDNINIQHNAQEVAVEAQLKPADTNEEIEPATAEYAIETHLGQNEEDDDENTEFADGNKNYEGEFVNKSTKNGDEIHLQSEICHESEVAQAQADLFDAPLAETITITSSKFKDGEVKRSVEVTADLFDATLVETITITSSNFKDGEMNRSVEVTGANNTEGQLVENPETEMVAKENKEEKINT